MAEEYMPSVDEVRKYYDPSIAGRFKTFFSNPKRRNEDYAELSEEINAEFDRWLAAHDAQIRADAWEEGRIAEHDEANGWGDAINPYLKEQK